MSFEDFQHIEVVAQFPVAFVGFGFSRKVWRINEEHNTIHVFILCKQVAVICLYDFNTVEIAICIVIGLSDDIVEACLSQFVERECLTA